MIDNCAQGPETAGPRAWVRAVAVEAGLRLWTFGADDAFRPAGWRGAPEAWQARARGVACLRNQAPTVGSARRRVAWVRGLVGDWRHI